MIPKITLRQLQFLVSFAHHLHFGRAAEECCLSQPAFSIGIKNTEKQLGIQLVDRSKKQITLTSAGIRVAEQAEHILNQVQQLDEIALSCKEPFSGRLRCLLYTSPSPRDRTRSRMPSSA